jgi:hypothetical protein
MKKAQTNPLDDRIFPEALLPVNPGDYDEALELLERYRSTLKILVAADLLSDRKLDLIWRELARTR